MVAKNRLGLRLRSRFYCPDAYLDNLIAHAIPATSCCLQLNKQKQTDCPGCCAHVSIGLLDIHVRAPGNRERNSPTGGPVQAAADGDIGD